MQRTLLFVFLTFGVIAGALFFYWSQRAPSMPIAGSAITATPAQMPNLAPTPDAAATAAATPAAAQASTSRAATRDLVVHTVWKDTGADAAGTSVTLVMLPYEGNTNNTRAVFADAQGRATFALPADWRNVGVTALNPDSARAEQTAQLPMAEELLLQLVRGASVFGTVVLEGNATPAEGALVSVKNEQGVPVTSGRSDASGAFEIKQIAAARVFFTATKGALASNPDGTQKDVVELKAGQRHGPVTIILKQGLAIIGTARELGTNAPVANVQVDLSAGQLGAGPGPVTTKTGADGSFRLEGLNAQRYQVRAAAAQYATVRTSVQPGPAPETRLDLEMEPGGDVLVTVVDKEDKPVEGAMVLALESLQSSNVDRSIFTDAQGKATVKGANLSKPPMMMALKDGFDIVSGPPPTVKFPQNSRTAEIKLILNRMVGGGVFEGKVVDAKDAPVVGASVQWYMPTNPNGQSERTLTDIEGKYRLAVKSAPMQSQLIAFSPGFAPNMKGGLSPGAEDKPAIVDFQLEPGHYIEGVVVTESEAPVVGARVIPATEGISALPFPNHSEGAVTDAQGKFRFDDLPGPRVQLVARREPNSMKRETYAVDTSVKIVFQDPGVIRGRAIDAADDKPITQFSVKPTISEFMGLPMEQAMEAQTFRSEDGRFVLKDLPAEQVFRLEVESQSYGAATQASLKPAKEDTAVEVVFRMNKQEALRGKVVDGQSGSPIADAQIVYALQRTQGAVDWNNLSSTNPSLSGFQQAKTDSAGQFEFKEAATEGTLFVRAAGYERRMIEPTARATMWKDKQLSIELTSGASVSGTYTVGNAPQPNQHVLLTREERGLQTDLLYSMLTQPTGGVQLVERNPTGSAGEYAWDNLAPGRYQITAQYIENNMGIFRFGRRFDLTNGEKKSVNLGEELGPLSLTGKLLKSDATPLSFGILTLQPQFEWDYSDFGDFSDPSGAYRIDGLRPGLYKTMLLVVDMTSGGYLTSFDTIELTGNLEHDFTLRQGFKATGKLVYPEGTTEAARKKFAMATLIADTGNTPGAGISGFGTSIVQNDVVSFTGAFQGNYTMRLSDLYGSASLILPQFFTVDTTAADVNLGDILVPQFGRLRVQHAFEPQPDSAPIATLVLTPASGGEPKRLDLDPLKMDEELAQVASGAYVATMEAAGYTCDPATQPVTVATEATASLVFMLRKAQ